MNRTILVGTLALLLATLGALPPAAAAPPGPCDVVNCDVVSNFVRFGEDSACLAVLPEYGGTMTCAHPRAGCVSHFGGAVRETVCAKTILALLLP